MVETQRKSWDFAHRPINWCRISLAPSYGDTMLPCDAVMTVMTPFLRLAQACASTSGTGEAAKEMRSYPNCYPCML